MNPTGAHGKYQKTAVLTKYLEFKCELNLNGSNDNEGHYNSFFKPSEKQTDF